MKNKHRRDQFKGMLFDDYLKEELKDPEFKKLYIREGIKLKIAFKIHELRHKLGITQTALAKKIGTTQSHVARMEHGNTNNYEIKTLQRIAEATGKKLVVNFI